MNRHYYVHIPTGISTIMSEYEWDVLTRLGKGVFFLSDIQKNYFLSVTTINDNEIYWARYIEDHSNSYDYYIYSVEEFEFLQ